MSEFLNLADSYAEKLLELDEAKEMSLAFAQGDGATQIKIRYRQLMRALHPDLRPDGIVSDFEMNLFVKLQKAYEDGDLAGLQRAEIAPWDCGV